MQSFSTQNWLHTLQTTDIFSAPYEIVIMSTEGNYEVTARLGLFMPFTL